MRTPSIAAVLLGIGISVALSSCSGSGSSATLDTVAPVHPGSVSTTVPSSATTGANSSHVERFEAPSDVSCTGDTTTIQVMYATADLTAVSFVVDGKPLTGVAVPATSGEFPVPLPCDGNVHTIQLVGSGPSGPAFASKAVITRPA